MDQSTPSARSARQPALRITGAGQALFAATLIGLGVWGLASGDLAPIWRPVVRRWHAREALVWITAILSLACGAGLLWRRTAAAAAGVLTAFLLVWMLALRAPAIIAWQGVADAWESCGETAVPAAAAWALLAAAGEGRGRLAVVTGARGRLGARILYALAMLAFGAAHLQDLRLTASLVPSWLPAHVVWAELTGVAYIAAGVAMLTGVLARLAATLSAVQMGLFTLLVWAPSVVGSHGDAGAWSEAVVSWTLTTAGWVVAESYGGLEPRPDPLQYSTPAR